MKISRLDLDGIGSPRALAQRIHELEDLPLKVPLEQLCAALDIVAIEQTVTKSFEALLVTDSLKSSGAITLNSDSPWHRQRFSLAHELGHFLIEAHRPREGFPMECALGDLHMLNPKDKDRRRRIEAEANNFAAHLLMPPKRIRELVGASGVSLQTVVQMAGDFGVSKEAMARAFVEAHRDPVAIVVSQHGQIQRFYRGEEFPYLDIQKSRPLPSGSLSIDEGAEGGYSEIEEIEADVWLSQSATSKVLCLDEQVLWQRGGYRLTLLQAELDEEE